MASWTWKQAVADEVLALVNRNKRLQFELDEICEATPRFQARFPKNRHVREIIRKSLQQLRDTGFLSFLGGAKYAVDPTYSELDFEPVPEGEQGLPIPQIKSVVRRIRLRNTLLASDVKERYEHVCQVCRAPVILATSLYSESHHLKPLGSPHLGPDIQGNIIVVCPNHHVMFDRCALFIEPDTLMVRHVANALRARPLFLKDWHRLNRPCLLYQHQRILRGA